MFGWLTPWIYVPSLLLAPLFQILLFVYIGRNAGLESDSFYLVGNALQYVAIPCLFAMTATVANERSTQTLSLVLGAPARRLPLFLGRALPVLVNGCVVALFSLAVGSLLLDVRVPAAAWPSMALISAVAAAACTGFGLISAALALRVRETAVLSNIVFGVLLLFCGVNVPIRTLPNWMAAISPWLPLTHAIEAARLAVAEAGWADLAPLILKEGGLGLAYFAIGMTLLSLFEHGGRRSGALERA
ncbi:ABC transporter permease [Streptomyces sp. NPDC058459]|uniref:ABC transporter permease n=1 Tax=Streptomyces sp. NPDC058459 TaxID=3346508 RepID=UPI003669B09D